MVSVSNCEIGKRALGSLPSLFRAICMNGCIWGQAYGEKIKVVHRGEIDLDQLEQAHSLFKRAQHASATLIITIQIGNLWCNLF